MIGGRRVSKMADAMLILVCVECVRSIMDSEPGLNLFAGDEEACQKLIIGEFFFKNSTWSFDKPI